MYQLKVIIASTRENRKGPVVADWVLEVLKEHPEFQVTLLDLKEINLPMMDEPEHPRLQKYTHEHTKQWSRMVDSADAFVIVTSEYNYSMPAPLKNALDYLSKEWAYKPAAIVSYGGVSAGTRGAEVLKSVLSALDMVPLSISVSIPFFTKYINPEGKFIGGEIQEKAAHNVFKELLRWTNGLRSMRQQ